MFECGGLLANASVSKLLILVCDARRIPPWRDGACNTFKEPAGGLWGILNKLPLCWHRSQTGCLRWPHCGLCGLLSGRALILLLCKCIPTCSQQKFLTCCSSSCHEEPYKTCCPWNWWACLNHIHSCHSNLGSPLGAMKFTWIGMIELNTQTTIE